MHRMTRSLAVLGLVAALGLIFAGVGSAGTAAKPTFKSPQLTLKATLIVKSDEQHGKKGTDGKWHDALLPANFSALAGVPVKVTVFNYDDMPHSFTSPSLHLNAIIPGAKGSAPGTVTFTFTPKAAGNYLWWCAKPCDPWAMAHVGFMRGYVHVA